MRLFVVLSVTSFVAAAATFACSSGDSAATPADAGKDAKPTTQASGDDDDKQENTNTSTTGTDAGDLDASDGATTTGPGGDLVTTGDGGTACDSESFREAETNNDPATANKLAVKIGSTKICGQVTSTDPDFITFKMPDGANGFFVQPSGGFQISGTIDGQPFNGTNFGGIDVNQGATWVVKVETGSATPRAWRLRFDFNQ